MVACTFYQNALRALTVNDWIKFTQNHLMIRSFSTTKKLTSCLMPPVRQTIFIPTTMHSGKMYVHHLFCYGQFLMFVCLQFLLADLEWACQMMSVTLTARWQVIIMMVQRLGATAICRQHDACTTMWRIYQNDSYIHWEKGSYKKSQIIIGVMYNHKVNTVQKSDSSMIIICHHTIIHNDSSSCGQAASAITSQYWCLPMVSP